MSFLTQRKTPGLSFYAKSGGIFGYGASGTRTHYHRPVFKGSGGFVSSFVSINPKSLYFSGFAALSAARVFAPIIPSSVKLCNL